MFTELKTSLISSSSGVFNGRPDPLSWRTTKATENKLTKKHKHRREDNLARMASENGNGGRENREEGWRKF